MATFELSEPTIFPDLNQKEGQPEGHTRTHLELITLKYKHFREAVRFPEADQMHQLMLAMTGLSEDDIGELTPNDAAGLSLIIFEAMKKYMELGQQMIKGIEK